MLKVKVSSLPLRGYHDYKKRLEEPVKCGEQLELLIETKRFGGTCTFPVAAVRNKDGNSETVGHIPKEFSWCFKVVIRAGGKIVAIVTNEKPERRERKYGEEIICEYIFHGPNKPEIRHALRNLKKVLKEPFWNFYQPKMVFCIQEDNKEECVEWSLKEESDNREREGMQDSMPEELQNDPFTKQLYEKAIKYGKEIDRSIRVMVIGCFGQGKTSLVKRLFEEPIYDIGSTNGINVNQFEVKDNNWKRKDSDEIDAGKRLVSVSHSTQSFEMEQSESDDVGSSGDFVQTTNGATDVFQDDNSQKRKEPEFLAPNICIDSQKNMKKMKVEGAMSKDVKKETKKTAGKTSNHSMDGTQKQMSKSDSDILKEFSSVMKKTSETDLADTSLAGTIWDFGGQFIFYSTHQLFHSRQAIYLLVFDLSKGLDETVIDADFPNQKNKKTLKDYIKFWVNSVHSFVGSENGEEPHIILVGTHKDKVEPDQDVDECFDNVRNLFEDSKLFNHIYYKHFAISNVEPDSKEVDSLRNIITELGKDLSEKNSPIPAKWIPLEKSLKEKQHPNITSFENILRINKENEFPIEEEDEIKLFLQFHHSRGGLFYFDDTELSKHVILNPQYLIDAFRCIVTSRKFCNVKQNLRAMWKKLCEKATLQPALIEEVWRNNNSGADFLEHKEVLLAFLQRHRIISEVQRYNEKENNLSSPEPLGYYIVPSFLKTQSSDKLISSFMEGKERTKVSLVYMFEYEGVVQTIYHKVTAAGIGNWPLIKFRDQSLLYENLSVFELKHGHAGMIFFNGNKLELLVINLSPPDNVSEAISDSFRCFFEAIVDWEFRKLREGDKRASERKLYRNLVRCFDLSHGNSGSKNMHEVDKNHYRGVQKIPCPDYESHCLRVEDAMKEWYFDDIDTETIPNRTLNIKECSKLATAIGEGWEMLGYQLGLGVVKIDQIKMDEDTTVKRITRMFFVWQQKYKDKATPFVLVAAIRNIPSKVLHINMDILKNVIYGYG